MKVFIRTFGCTLNQSDSEVMAGLLVKAGHKLVNDVKEAELVLFNTCTVKDNPEKRFFSELAKVLAMKKMVVVAGCVPQAEPGNELLRTVSVVGVRNLSSIAYVVDQASRGNVVRMLEFSNNPRLNLPKVRKNPVVEIIPLCSGCLGECTYCKTRLARGKLLSYDAKAIKQQLESAVADGVKEVWLTSQDCGAYGKDIGSSLPTLLKELLVVEGDYRIRVGMINPNHMLEFIDDYISILKNPKVFKFAHLPVQSGSNRILKLMKRKYVVEDFVKIAKRLRKEIPMITLATDIICGFPGETEADFEMTYKLMERLRIPVVNITKYSPRSGTPADKMQKLPTKVIKPRSKRLMELQARIADNREWLGWQGNIIIDEIGKTIVKNISFVGRNDYYKPVVVKSRQGQKGRQDHKKLKLGDVIEVRVVAAAQHFLEANKYG
ncbi:tRNA (N(6)-L-threonylcarbamoyladenosine(37)-C(2))-methylthiotransferase [Candidatus Woesearchaeota archaeon]|nr:tRNA (N(6)-L-threonylcarbamoyladenosine(37)-C(2))-methylthiotransferase [Candidatus Woesearchaeota archaeon]